MSFFVICLMTLLFLVFLCSVLTTSLLIIVPKCSANVLSSVVECKKAVVFFIEKIRVLDKLLSGMSYHVVIHELNANK